MASLGSGTSAPGRSSPRSAARRERWTTSRSARTAAARSPPRTLDDDTARVWELPSGRLAHSLRHEAVGVDELAFSPDGRQLITTVYSGFGDEATIWDVGTGQRVTAFGDEDQSGATWAPDGRRVATIGDGQIAVWDARTGRALRSFPERSGDFAEVLAFSPDGRRLAMAGDGGAFIATLANGKVVRLRGPHERPNDVSFCPDGTCFMTGSDDDTAHIWSLSGRERAVLRGHTSDVVAASFSRDGRYVVTASEDSTARVWSRHSGAELAVLRGHDGAARGRAFPGRGQPGVHGRSRRNGPRLGSGRDRVTGRPRRARGRPLQPRRPQRGDRGVRRHEAVDGGRPSASEPAMGGWLVAHGRRVQPGRAAPADRPGHRLAVVRHRKAPAHVRRRRLRTTRRSARTPSSSRRAPRMPSR